jgi:hypothetical protein
VIATIWNSNTTALLPVPNSKAKPERGIWLTHPHLIPYANNMKRFILSNVVGLSVAISSSPGQAPKKALEPIPSDHAEKMVKGLDVFAKHVKPIPALVVLGDTQMIREMLPAISGLARALRTDQ